jgi:hypothetical protein
MKPLDLLVTVVGVVVLCIAHYFPDVSGLLYAVGGGLTTGGMPAVSSALRPRDSQRGAISWPMMIFLACCLLALLAGLARAQEVPRRGCLVHDQAGGCELGARVSAVVPAAVVNLKTGDFMAGAAAAAFGPCVGLSFRPEAWYTSGIDLCAAVRAGTGAPNEYTGALMLHVSSWASIGIGTSGVQQPGGGLAWQGRLYLSPRIEF